MIDYGLTSYQIAAWDRVNICEEGGNWYVNGSVFAGGLGMTRANWAQFNTFGFPSNAAYATPLQQIRVAVAFAVHYYGNPNCGPRPERLRRRLLTAPPTSAGRGPTGSRPPGRRWPGPGPGRAR